MTSTVACVGFTDPSALAAIVREDGAPFHELSSTAVWTDSSGATLYLDRASHNARPAFRTEVRTPYEHLTALENGLAEVRLTDADGAPVESVTAVPNARYTVGWAASGHVALVAMGLDTEFFATAEDFFDSPRSALPGAEAEPPPEVRQFGLPWPPPMELESFLPRPDEATAVLTGTVQSSQVRTNTRTGHEFLVARIATSFGEVDLVTPVPIDGAPAPGGVVVGTVEMVATFPPHGEPDTSGYTAPTDRIQPTFRDTTLVEGGESDVVLDDADIAMPDGLVLGEDGVVRTEDEHRAWRGGSSSSANPAAAATPTETPVVTEPESAPALPRADATDDTPRPGETRREWRARTGRS